MRLRPGVTSIPIDVIDSDDEPTDFDPYFSIVKSESGEDGDDGKGGQASKVCRLTSKVFEIPDDDGDAPAESMAQPVESLPRPPHVSSNFLEKKVKTEAISGTSVSERIKLIKLPGHGLIIFFSDFVRWSMGAVDSFLLAERF